MRSNQLLISAAAIVVCALPASAQKDTAAKLPTVTVTATRSAASILTTPLAITKIGEGELRATRGFGLDDALKSVPGVLAQSRYGTSDVRIVIRGFGARGAGDRSNAGTSRGVRFLIDGIPETEPDGRTSFDQFDLAASSAIEVIRSNASSTWGNAAGGVVNVMTPIWADNPTIEAQPMSGSFGLKRLALRGSTPAGSDGTAYFNFTNTEFDGWRQHSSARRQLLNVGAVGQLGEKTRVGVYASGANNLFHLPGALTATELAADRTAANAQYLARDERRYNRVLRIGGTIDHDITPAASVSSMLYLNPKYLQRSERGTFRDFTRYHVGGNFLGHYKTSKMHFTAGVDESFQDGAILFYGLTPTGGRATDLRDNKSEGANEFGAFLQDEVMIGEKLNLLLGARYEEVNYYSKSFINPALDADKKFNKITPKIGASWKLGATKSLYANYGGGIEVPAGNEVDPFAAQGTTAINPLLEPIVSKTIEAGYKMIAQSFGPLSLTGDVAVYSTSVENDLQPYNEGRFYMSAGKSSRKGVELGLMAETKRGIFANVAMTASSNKYLEYSVDSSLFRAGAGTGVFDDNKIIGIPDVMGEVELGIQFASLKGLRIKGGLEHVGKYFADDANAIEIPSYSIFNVTAELRRPIATAGGWGVKGFVSIHNVTDKEYIGSAYLNPIYVSGQAQVYEPGTPRAVTLSLSVGRLK